MSSEYRSFLQYLGVTRLQNSDATLDQNRLQIIREKFDQIHGDNDRDDEDLRRRTVEKVMDDLKITNDQTSMEYFDLTVLQQSDDDAELEIIEKFRGSAQFLEPVIFDEPKPSRTKPSASELIGNKTTSIEEVICIIHQKSNREEVSEFLRRFLFQQLSLVDSPSANDPSDPLFDHQVHPIPSNSIIDLFIREQMIERGMITFPRPRTRFRLVEPISLTDEFDAWVFDHFHGLIDFWLTLDLKNQKPLPKEWRLNPQAKLSYVIQNQLYTTDDQQTSKTLDRPSTKSLENFIRDVCQMEENGMFNEWFKALTENENISTYAHLTNLNQKEWEQIKELPMNALKTMKFYVDREKQMVDQRKTKKTKDQKPEQQASYSEAELRANLHMIKLYLIRQLEGHDDVPVLPRLETFCVEKAFEEMRDEGYEDDGLFDEMKLFFQPLTVTEKELTISSTLLDNLKQEQATKKEALDAQIKIIDEQREDYENQLKTLKNELKKIEEQRVEDYRQSESDAQKPENKPYQKQIELDRAWLKKNEDTRKEQEEKKASMNELHQKILDVGTERTTCENSLKMLEQPLDKKHTEIDRRLVKPHRGFIMYGPPGTGKSVIMSKLAKKIGIAMVGPPLAAGELERPLVGQSEAIILDLCMRGNRLPHLMCCVSIDEIDSLAPRRDEDSSEGKVAKISVLLSVIEGIKDVSNLMFFSATNRLHMMDEAFLRRMSGKFFVGRPSSDARKRILEGVPKTILLDDIRTKLATATTNFSGAALKALTSAITVHYLAQRRLNEKYEMKEDETLILADRTARQYQLYLGLDTLPRLLLRNLDDLRQLADEKKSSDSHLVEYHLPNDVRFTGKILISLEDRRVRMEAIGEKNKRYVIEDKLKIHEESLQQLLDRIASYGNDRNVQLLQLVDLNLLSSKGAHDEKKIFETLKERYDECMEYRRSMIIYDLDSLIGVNQSESESSMGTSTSSSVVNQSIYIYVTSRFREAKVELNRSNSRQVVERWAIAVVRDQFLLRKFTADVGFTLTSDQERQEKEDRRRSSEELTCVKCRDLYIESENKMGACGFHDGFVYDNLSLDLKQYRPSEAIKILNLEEYLAFQDSSKKEEFEKKKTRMKYICCFATVQVGSGFQGCKKGKHGFKNIKYTNHGGQRLDNEMLYEWETKCMEDVEYNKRHTDLFDSRNTS